MRKTYFIRILLALALTCGLILAAGCGEKAADQALEQYDKTVGEANRVSVNTNLTIINGSIRIYYSNNTGSPTVDGLLNSGLMASWPQGPDSVTYELAEKNGKMVAVANRNNAADWWTSGEDQIAYPVQW